MRPSDFLPRCTAAGTSWLGAGLIRYSTVEENSRGEWLSRMIPWLMLMLMLPLVAPFGGQTSLISTASGEEVCCDSIRFDLLFSGPSSSGQLSPFESSQGTEQSTRISSAIAQETEVGRWSGQLNFGGPVSSSTWNFVIPYRVDNAIGVSINATVEVRIGSEVAIGETGLGQTFLPGEEGTLSIDIDVGSMTLLPNDAILAIFSVRELLLPTGNDPSVEFIWGTEEFLGLISAELPLFDVDMNDPIVEGRSVHFPVRFDSGYGSQLVAESSFGFSADGDDIAEQPVLTSGNMLTWTWNVDSGLDDGTYQIEISISFQNGTNIVVSEEFSLQFGDDSGSGTFYPLTEPERFGASELQVSIQAEMGTDLEKTITMYFEDRVAFWLRWGIDNMGNPNLNSSSWLKALDPAHDDYFQNRELDQNEVNSFEQQLRQSQLTDFLGKGLGLETRRLLGMDREKFDYVGVEILLHSDSSVSNTGVTIIIRTRQSDTAGQEQLLLDNFIKPQFDESSKIWESVSFELELRTDAFTGVFLRDVTGVEASQTRLILKEVISASVTFTQADQPRIWVQQSSTPVESPMIVFLICTTVALAGLFAAMFIARSKRKLVLFTEVILLGTLGFVAYFLSIEFLIVLALAVIASAVWVVTAMMASPAGDDIYDDLFDPVPTGGRPGRSRRRSLDTSAPALPTFDCPNCGTSNPITSDERPLRIPCPGCDKVLKIV